MTILGKSEGRPVETKQYTDRVGAIWVVDVSVTGDVTVKWQVVVHGEEGAKSEASAKKEALASVQEKHGGDWDIKVTGAKKVLAGSAASKATGAIPGSRSYENELTRARAQVAARGRGDALDNPFTTQARLDGGLYVRKDAQVNSGDLADLAEELAQWKGGIATGPKEDLVRAKQYYKRAIAARKQEGGSAADLEADMRKLGV